MLYSFPEVVFSGGYLPFEPLLKPGFQYNNPCLGSSMTLEFLENYQVLCVIGYPKDEKLRISIYNPNGNLVDALWLTVEDSPIAIPLRFELDLPIGIWQVVVSLEDMSSNISIPYGLNGKPLLSYYRLLLPPAISPMDPRRLVSYRAGETVVVQGINFPPGTDLPVGIYEGDKPIQGEVLRTNADGSVITQFKLEGSFPLMHRIIAFQDISKQNSVKDQIWRFLALESTTGSQQVIFPNSPMALGDDMQPNEVLYPRHAISSTNGLYTFVCQTDGNLVLYQIREMIPIWTSNTTGSQAGVCIMQSDGNLVIYDLNANPIWASNTCCDSGNWLLVQNDGNVVLYRPDNTPIWSTNTVQP